MYKKLRKINMIVLLCILTFFISACSYKEFEDAMRSKLNSKNEGEQYHNPSSIPDSTSKSEEDTLFTIDDAITYSYPDRQSVQYTLNQVHILDNINDLNLNADDFADKNFISEDGTVDDAYRLVAVNITVENVDFVGHNSEKEGALLFIESSVGFKEGIEDPAGPFVAYASYFSEHPPLNQNNGEDYYQFSLPLGKKMDAMIGWFLPLEQLRTDPLYYIIGGEGSPEYYQYFELNSNLGENYYE